DFSPVSLLIAVSCGALGGAENLAKKASVPPALVPMRPPMPVEAVVPTRKSAPVESLARASPVSLPVPPRYVDTANEPPPELTRTSTVSVPPMSIAGAVGLTSGKLLEPLQPATWTSPRASRVMPRPASSPEPPRKPDQFNPDPVELNEVTNPSL